MKYNSSHALRLLRLGTAIANAFFREGQEQAIQHIVEGRGRITKRRKAGRCVCGATQAGVLWCGMASMLMGTLPMIWFRLVKLW